MFPIKDNIPRRSLPVVTWLLIAVNAVVFYFEFSMSEADLIAMIGTYGVIPERVLDREDGVLALRARAWLPFFTSMFLHGGLVHLFGNMWTLWIFGDNVEDRMGSLRFLAFYFFCGLVAGFTHTLTNADSSIPTVGASGAIAGCLGAYLLLFPRARVTTVVPVLIYPLFFEVPAFFYLLWWFMLQIFSGASMLGLSGASGDVAWWAHVGGFVAGALLFPFFMAPRRSRGWPERRGRWS